MSLPRQAPEPITRWRPWRGKYLRGLGRNRVGVPRTDLILGERKGAKRTMLSLDGEAVWLPHRREEPSTPETTEDI